VIGGGALLADDVQRGKAGQQDLMKNAISNDAHTRGVMYL
jgi:hypothetical protein